MRHLTEIALTEVGGFQVGHAEDSEAMTGCTAILFDDCSPAGVDVRGGGPASRETPLLNPLADAKGLHALLLSGGSAFGLDAGGGVMKYLEEHGIGFDVGVTKVPLVCTSCLFDLGVGRMDVRPDAAMAYHACENASRDTVPEGNVGAGMGCTIGKYRGISRAMKSGLGTYAVQAGRIKVGAIVAVNALGDVYDIDHGQTIAGLRTPDGKSLSSTEEEILGDIADTSSLFSRNTNTTIGAIFTNGAFDKSQLTKIAGMTHNGYARTIRPVHTTADGDSIYAVSVGKETADLNVVGTIAAYIMGKAINRAVLAAEGLGDLPAAREL